MCIGDVPNSEMITARRDLIPRAPWVEKLLSHPWALFLVKSLLVFFLFIVPVTLGLVILKTDPFWLCFSTSLAVLASFIFALVNYNRFYKNDALSSSMTPSKSMDMIASTVGAAPDLLINSSVETVRPPLTRSGGLRRSATLSSLAALPRSIDRQRRAMANAIRRSLSSWQWELFQLTLTFLGCVMYEWYLWSLTYSPDSSGEWSYHLSLNLDSFVPLEYALLFFFACDIIFRAWAFSQACITRPETQTRDQMLGLLHFLIDRQQFIDLMAFTCGAYVNVICRAYEPHPPGIYNLFLFHGCLRFLRMRRSLRILERRVISALAASEQAARQDDSQISSPPMVQVFLFSVPPGSVEIFLFVAKSFLFILFAASLVVAVEYPCPSLSLQPDLCSTDLQKLFQAIYFVVVSFTTVGSVFRLYLAVCDISLFFPLTGDLPIQLW